MGMSLIINAPSVEHQLEEEAKQHGVSAEQYAVEILSHHLSYPGAVLHAPSHLTPTQRINLLDDMIKRTANRPQLKPEAFERASFYPESVA